MNLRSTASLIVLAVFTCVSAAHSAAQNTTGSITGLTDQSGAVVAGATVIITNTGTQARRTLASDSSGDFTATLLLPGSYTVTSTMTGFKTEVRNVINL